ncbi:MAG: hypothetical protein FWD02_00795 [Bacteroidales bacterium]|nr:hypothetical protein [Bacteroidales bacterium]
MCNCPPPPPTQQEIDCARLVAIAENQFINNYIDTLIRGRMASSSAPDTFEFGDMIRTVNGVHESFPKRSYPFRARYSLRAGAQYSHGFHSHPRGFHPFPSATDLWTLWRIYNFGSMQNPSEFVWGIITDTSTVILQIEDAARFNNFFYGIFNANNRDSSAARNAFDNFYYQIRRDFIVSDDVNEGHRGRAEFFLYDLGLRQKVSTGPPSSDGSITRRWRIYGRNSSGQVVVIDC